MIFIDIENIVLFYKLGGVLDNSILILVWIGFLFYIDGKGKFDWFVVLFYIVFLECKFNFICWKIKY